MFKYEVLSEDQLKGSGKLREGMASFRIINAEDTDKNGYQLTSKAGNPMMKVSYSVTDQFGSNGILNDFFLSNQSWKIAKLLDCLGKSEWYKTGGLSCGALKGLSGQCNLKKDPSPEYPDQVKISAYIERSQSEVANDQRPQDYSSVNIDDIPF